MAKLPDPELRRVLSELVSRRVAGSGISRTAVDDAVARVVDALAAPGALPGNHGPSLPAKAALVATLSARSVPDLASRVRRDLERDGIVIDDLGIGTAGQHTVVALRVAADARPGLERLAERSRYALSFVNT